MYTKSKISCVWSLKYSSGVTTCARPTDTTEATWLSCFFYGSIYDERNPKKWHVHYLHGTDLNDSGNSNEKRLTVYNVRTCFTGPFESCFEY